MKLRLELLACMVLLLAPVAPANAQDAMMDAFKASQAASEANDLPEAERQAVLALEAAEGQASPKRGLLAVNLASVLYRAGKFAEAKAAAAQAQAAIAAGAEGEAWAARLIELKARVKLEEPPAIRSLEQALRESPPLSAGNARDIFDAALVLGRGRLAKQAWVEAARGYELALQAAAPAFGLPYADRATALIGLVAAEFRRKRLSVAEAYAEQAVAVTQPFAIESEGPVASQAERIFARALAWRSYLRTKSKPSKEFGGDSSTRPLLLGKAPLCAMQAEDQEAIRYPIAAEMKEREGVVVLRLSVDAEGRVTNAAVIAAVPVDFGFESAGLSAMRGARMVRWSGAKQEACRMQTDSLLQIIRFHMLDW